MDNSNWDWANLSRDQMDMLAEAEQTLGADYLLAFQPEGQRRAMGFEPSKSQLAVAPLNDSQVECLQGLETKLQAVVIAYTQM